MGRVVTYGVVPVAERSISRRGRTRGFTMIELMVILAIIVILISILFPSFRAARESARAARCQNNLHQLANAFFAFAADHDHRLPGGIGDATLPEIDHRDWLMSDPADYTTGPQGGTIYKYVGGIAEIYRCPSLDALPPKPGSMIGRFKQSNGRFDYAAVLVFTGANLGNIQGQSQMLDGNGNLVYQPTPLVVEQDPLYINGFNMKGAHCGQDTITHTHRGGGYYASITGAVVWINEPQTSTGPQGAARWQSEAASGNWISFAESHYHWGAWNYK